MAAQRLELDREAGDIPARESEVCQHGHAGYCHDEALPEERRAVEFIHASSYSWALPRGRDLAEAYATWQVHRSWHPGVVLMDANHPLEFPKFEAETS